MASDRRNAPRIEILGSLHGHSVSLDVPVGVRELSLGGMAVETELPLPEGVVQEFQLTLGDQSTVRLTGRILHCRNVADQDETPRYVSGIQFIDGSDAAEAGGIIDRIR